MPELHLSTTSSKSSNLGRPTSLSDGRPLSTISVSPTNSSSIVFTLPQVDPIVQQYGINDFESIEEKGINSTKSKSPVPAPKPSGRSSPHRGNSRSNQVLNTSVSPPYHAQDARLRSLDHSRISPNHNLDGQSSSAEVLSLSHSKVLSSPEQITTGSMVTQIVPVQAISNNPVTSSLQSPRHLHIPQATCTSNVSGQSTGKRSVEIGRPVDVPSFSNELDTKMSANLVDSVANLAQHTVSNSNVLPSSLEIKDMSSMLEHYTSELENIGSSFISPHHFSTSRPLGEPVHDAPSTFQHPGFSEST